MTDLKADSVGTDRSVKFQGQEDTDEAPLQAFAPKLSFQDAFKGEFSAPAPLELPPVGPPGGLPKALPDLNRLERSSLDSIPSILSAGENERGGAKFREEIEKQAAQLRSDVSRGLDALVETLSSEYERRQHEGGVASDHLLKSLEMADQVSEMWGEGLADDKGDDADVRSVTSAASSRNSLIPQRESQRKVSVGSSQAQALASNFSMRSSNNMSECQSNTSGCSNSGRARFGMPAIPDGDCSQEVISEARFAEARKQRASVAGGLAGGGRRASVAKPKMQKQKTKAGGRLSFLGGGGGGRKTVTGKKKVIPQAVDAVDEPPTRHRNAHCKNDVMCDSASLTRSDTAGLTVQVSQCWLDMAPTFNKQSTCLTVHNCKTMMSLDDIMTQDIDQQRLPLVLERLQARVLHPGSARRFVWDVAGFILIFYDIVTVPLQFFDLQQASEMMWVVRLFWSIDIFVNLCTGHLKEDGFLEVRLGAIFKRYFKSWLLIDLLIVIVDWCDVFDGISELVTGRLGKTARAIRVLRMMRLLRIVRLSSISGTWLEQAVRSEKLMLVMTMTKLVVGLVMLMHFMACIWYGIGTMGDKGWVEIYIVTEAKEDTTLGRYMTSFHWSLSQFHGSMEMVPQTVSERVFAVLFLVVAFLLSATFISNITSAMTRLNIISGNEAAMLATLKDYLTDRGISRKLTIRVQRNAQHALNVSKARCAEEDVELLDMISEPLRMEIHFELYAPVLKSHPLFQYLEHMAPSAVRRLCHSAIKTSFISQGDLLFADLEVKDPPEMFFVTKGEIGYKQFGAPFTKKVGVGVWLAEPVLWASWVHRGIATSRSEDCEMLVLDATGFRGIAGQNSIPNVNLSLYAIKFAGGLNKRHPTDLDDGLAEETIESIDEYRNEEDDVVATDTGRSSHSSVSWFPLGKKLLRSCSSLAPSDFTPGASHRSSVMGNTSSSFFDSAHPPCFQAGQAVKRPSAMLEPSWVPARASVGPSRQSVLGFNSASSSGQTMATVLSSQEPDILAFRNSPQHSPKHSPRNSGCNSESLT